MWYFLRSIKNHLEFYFEQFFHGEETLRIENTGPVVVLESGVYGKFRAQPVKRYEVRSKSGRVDRVSSGYVLEKPWPASRMIQMSDGFLAGDNEQDAVNHLHSLINLEKDIDRDIGRPL